MNTTTRVPKTVTLYNTASRQKEILSVLDPNGIQVKLYCCGPTVYHFAHLGNLRTFLFEDFLVRMLRYAGYDVTHVMNITDVGHLTSDGDEGEDKLELGAKREGKTVWEVAQYYIDAFIKDQTALNILPPTHMPRATDCIAEQISLIEILSQKGFTYVANGNVYFDTAKFAKYSEFANLNLEASQKSRVEQDAAKKSPQDFVLWFTNSKFDNHAMLWDSPWGRGYPGWHIECSAMAKKHLGETIDIHCGGIDHIPVHHTNEIAQSECAHGKPFANLWMHSEFLIDKDGKMSKSKGDFLTVALLNKKGYDPIAYRYLCLMTHYRKSLSFSWDALDSAATTLTRLREKVQVLLQKVPTQFSITELQEMQSECAELTAFVDAITDDLNMPLALSHLHEVVKIASAQTDLNNIANYLSVIAKMDCVLGLDLLDISKITSSSIELPDEISDLVALRAKARLAKDWQKSDDLRDMLLSKGYIVKDSKDGQEVSLR